MATINVRIKVDGKTYTACFYDMTFGELKWLKANQVVNDEDFSEDGWWALHFDYNNGQTLVVRFEVDEDGERTTNPIDATILNEEGVIIDTKKVESVTIK